MKPKLLLQVPEPCHENWDNMTGSEKGRFCASCSKQVIDFTLMTDTELLNFFKTPKGNTCGRFSSDQLERALQPAKTEKKTVWKWMTAAIAALFIVPRADAQKSQALLGKAKTVTPPKMPVVTNCGIVKGETQPIIIRDRVITGKIQDEMKQPIPHASVAIESTKQVVSADPKGAFKLQADDDRQAYTLTISAVGYAKRKILVLPQQKNPLVVQLIGETMGLVVVAPMEKREKKIRITGAVTDAKNIPIPAATIYTGENSSANRADENGEFDFTVTTAARKLNLVVESVGFEKKYAVVDITEIKNPLKITLTPVMTALPDVTVISYPTIGCRSAIMGSVTLGVTNTPVSAEKTKTGFFEKKKPENNTAAHIRLYPNPAPKNTAVTIVTSEKGQHLVQLLDNNAVVLKSQMMVSEKQGSIRFPLPANIAAGMYYIRLTTIKTQHAVTTKLIVQ